ncbi:MAG: hypothetical protein ACE5IF_00695 [Candidatus Bathyarchaeia archaeon]
MIFDEFSGTLGEDRLRVCGLRNKRGGMVMWLSHATLEREIVELLKRRPCSAIDISATKRFLNTITESDILTVKVSDDAKYYSYKEGHE